MIRYLKRFLGGNGRRGTDDNNLAQPGGRHEREEIARHQRLARRCIERIPPAPSYRSKRGIVICGGGKRHFPSAWVCIRMLRHWGCILPIQLWHLGEFELDRRMEKLVEPHGVECVNGRDLAETRPARILNGWELKAYAILHSPFRQVVLLDADNVPLRDVEFLFETPQFGEHGAIFWPDYGRFSANRSAWNVFQVPYRDEPEFESGQIVVDKSRCHAALHLALHYNEYSDFYYRYIHGDKDTFRLAFHRLGRSFAMPRFPIHPLEATMCQHDFQGNRLFQHRNLDKWRLDGENLAIEGFVHEKLCFDFLAELRSLWSGELLWNPHPTDAEQEAIDSIGGSTFHYDRVGHDCRELEFRPDRTIGRGAAAMERRWTVLIADEGLASLIIHGDEGPTCALRFSEGAWRGPWFKYERMPIELRTTGDSSIGVATASVVDTV